MFLRRILLIFFWTGIILPLWASPVINLYGGISQGFTVFGGNEYDTYRAPTGVGIGIGLANFMQNFTLNGDFNWYGFPPKEDETSFGDSWMLTGLMAAGWMFPLLHDNGTFIGIGPSVAAGIYARSLIWNGYSTIQTKPLVQFSFDGVFRTEKSLYISSSFNLNGFMDEDPVWGISIDFSVGYSFGVVK